MKIGSMFLLLFRSDFFALHQIIEKYSEQVIKEKYNLEKYKGSLIIEMAFSHKFHKSSH